MIKSMALQFLQSRNKVVLNLPLRDNFIFINFVAFHLYSTVIDNLLTISLPC